MKKLKGEYKKMKTKEIKREEIDDEVYKELEKIDNDISYYRGDKK